ncbi:MAG: diaminopimelate decarboxylase [Proteobacteria bacterium]|nr:diaminopimelate decarboxylase [Pseudomonadota bacterium]MBW3616835.1 diaminopimelate decarboxylase [Pseudomonadota bacterium]
MDSAFHLVDGELGAEAVPLSAIAQAVGTPVYVYSASRLRSNFSAWRQAFPQAHIAYAVKANGNLSVLRTLFAAGAGADTVSEGEIRRALAAGCAPEHIIFSGMGKTDDELRFALSLPGIQINVESEPELDRLSELAARADARPLVAIRVNPDVAAGAHAKIATGQAHDKFGVPFDQTAALYRRAAADAALQPVGLAVHIGSQIADPAPFEAAWIRLRELARNLRTEGLPLTRLDLGGGLAADYGAGAPTPQLLGDLAVRLFPPGEFELSLEPGRSIVADAGVLLTRITHVNQRGDGPRFLVLDAGMNDLLRPALYDAVHPLRPVRPRPGEQALHDIVGPVCESSDRFAGDVRLPPFEPGDLAILSAAGAYGASMSSEYNARPLVPEVLVDGERWALVRPRPTFAEMLSREPLAPWL